MPARPNFYVLLGLDPTVTDPSVIDARIQEKKRDWSRQKNQGNPKDRRDAATALGLVREITAVMSDPAQRDAEAAQARTELAGQAERKKQALKDQVDILRTKESTYTREMVDQLVKGADGVVPAADVESLLKAAGLTPRVAQAPRPARERLDPVVAGNIRRNLDLLGVASLYAFLDLPPTTSLALLRKEADETYKNLIRIGATDPVGSARSELAGLCLQVFTSDESRNRYNQTLATERMDGLLPLIQTAGADGHITLQGLETLIQKAGEKGVAPQDAEDWIRELAQVRGWRIQPGQPAAASLPQCGLCNTLVSDPKATRCSRCGKPLHVDCPRCGTSVPTTIVSCPQCGANAGDAPLVDRYLALARRDAIDGNLAEALASVEMALLVWPGHKPILEEKARLQKRNADRDGALARVQAQEKARTLLQARTELEAFGRTWGASGTEALAQRIREGIGRADTAYKKGLDLRNKGLVDDAVAAFDEALGWCTDHPQAQQAAGACPPPPPTGLMVTPLPSGFRLTWKAPPSRSQLSYFVQRKADCQPAAVRDGSRVAETSACQVDDTSADVGRPLYYAVWAVRGATASATPAQAGPFLRVAEVQDLVAQAGDGCVHLSWTPPQGATRVEVLHQVQTPPAPGTGHAIQVSRSSGSHAGLPNGVLQGYRVVAVFRDPATGRDISSPGVTAVAIPMAPPPVVTDLSPRRSGANVCLTWTPIPGAMVQIRVAPSRPEAQAGRPMPQDRLDTLGTLVPEVAPGEALFEAQRPGDLFFTPVSVAGTLAVPGEPARVTFIDDVRDLKAQVTGRDILLTWTWPRGVETVLVRWRHDDLPMEPVGGTSAREAITMQAYQREDGWVLRNAAQKKHTFMVFASAPGAGQAAWSGGVKALVNLGQRITVSYEVVLKRNWLRKVTQALLEIRSDAPVDLPATLLVGRMDHLPLAPDQGEVLLRSGPMALGTTPMRLELPSTHLARPMFVKLFFQDPANVALVNLRPAPLDRLSLQ